MSDQQQTTAPALKANTYVARDIDGMRNGSVYRITGRKKEYAAHYINGDFMGFVSELPSGLAIYKPRKEAKKFLPSCFQ